MRRALAGLLALALSGCYEDTCAVAGSQDSAELEDRNVEAHLVSTMTLDAELSEPEQDAARRAAELWGNATNGRVQITLDLGVPTEHFAVRRAAPDVLKPGMLAGSTLTVIHIGPGLQDSGYMQGSLVHEFGHYLGLGHEPERPNDIMYPCTHAGMPDEPTPDALQDFGELYGEK